jgi:hypothetical protein
MERKRHALQCDGRRHPEKASHPAHVPSDRMNNVTSACVQVSRTPASQNHPPLPRQAYEKRQGTKSRAGMGSGLAVMIYGDLRRASVCFREVGTTDAPPFDGLIDRGERAPSALGSGSAWRRRSQDIGAASSSERHRRWRTVSGKNGKDGRRCVAVDDAMSIMTYRS